MQKRDDGSDRGGHDPCFVIADIFALKGGARTGLVVKPRISVYDSVMTEKCEGQKKCREWEPDCSFE
jgi:hypothetical protein